MTPVTPGELAEVTAAMRKHGVAGFSYRGCEVTFFEQLPLELQDNDDDEEEAEDRTKRVARARKAMLDEDMHGAS